MKDCIIHLDNIWKIYQIGSVKVEALKGVTVSIRRGEFVAITAYRASKLKPVDALRYE
jgi:putative ABC transport system ATP-binding protein